MLGCTRRALEARLRRSVRRRAPSANCTTPFVNYYQHEVDEGVASVSRRERGTKRRTAVCALDDDALLELRFRHSADARRAGVVHVLRAADGCRGCQRRAVRARRAGGREGGRRERTRDWMHRAQHSFSYPDFFHLAIRVVPLGAAAACAPLRGRSTRAAGRRREPTHLASAYSCLRSQSYSSFDIASRL